MASSKKPAGSAKDYRQMSDDLAQILAWFEQEEIDIDEAVDKYDAALKLIDDMEKYLKQTENKIKKISLQSK